ncbi:hypothetical protein VTO73DRAFT_9860 [Trametes versicolor]
MGPRTNNAVALTPECIFPWFRDRAFRQNNRMLIPKFAAAAWAARLQRKVRYISALRIREAFDFELTLAPTQDLANGRVSTITSVPSKRKHARNTRRAWGRSASRTREIR